MIESLSGQLTADARHWQIAALGALVVYSFLYLDFGAKPLLTLVALASVLAAQWACARLWRRAFEWRSGLITGLSLSLLLRTGDIWVMALAAVLAILSKFLIQHRGKHLFNPAAFGIVFVLLATHQAWVSPGQWGASIWVAALVFLLGGAVLTHAPRLDTAIAFLAAHFALLLARAAWLGDPVAIPLHQIMAGSLLIFAFFMVTDPRTTPDSRAGRILFAVLVAALCHWLAFFGQVRPALYFGLMAMSLLVPAIDRALPQGRFEWRPAALAGEAVMTNHRSLTKRAAFGLTLAAALATALQPAFAFCGFYVARADGKLSNKASMVVLARNGAETAITMASDYQGDPKDFALVIPVPTVVKKEDIHVVDQAALDRLDSYSEPRLVEYDDPDPCYAPCRDCLEEVAVSAARAPAPRDTGVKIEARYSVEEYEIVILSAQQSDGLQSWLTDNGYRIPAGAGEVLGSYIKQKMHFFIARVDLTRMKLAGRNFIRPLQVRYSSPKFMLPIRLGTVNADGPQDLILMALTQHGRVETTNYQTERVPSNIDVPLFIKDRFVDFYRNLFDRAVAKSGGASVFLEYAWNTSWCDPCSAPPPTQEELVTFGAGRETAPRADAVSGPSGTFLTRLHVRYDRAHFPEDLMLNETEDRQTFQARYIMNHLWKGGGSCDGIAKYRDMVATRGQQEIDAVAELTGWSRDMIKAEMKQSGEPLEYRHHLFDWLFKD
jgi:Na+-translocating ferredoxin:NAD+ oxidoreductase RnfD subunit